MPTDGRENIDERLADRARGDRRVPTPVVEGTGKKDGGDLSHRGQDEKDLTIGEETDFQTAAVSPELEEYANAKGRQQTLDRDIAELEKATGAMKDELEAQIAGKYKPQNIHHGQKKETRQSDLFEEEAEKLKARIDDVFDSDKRNRKDLEQDTIGRVGVTDIADGKQIVSLGGGRSGGSWSKEIDPKKEDVFQTAEDLRREGKRATKLTGDDYDVKPQSRKFMRRKLQEGKDKQIKEGLEALKSLDSILKRLDILKDRQSSFDEEENTDPLHAAAVKRKKKIIDQAKRDNVGLGWTKGIVDDKEKAHKSKYTSWNRMDTGVRNEHRNLLGLSSIADYDQLSLADQKKVKGAGFWKENLKEQPIKEGSHFGNVGSTPELQAEKRTTTKPEPKTAKIGSLRRKRRLGKSIGELKILTQVVKLASGDADTERIQHANPKPPTTVTPRGTAATSSLKPAFGESKSPWGVGENQTKPQQPQQSGAGGALPKTTGRGGQAAQLQTSQQSGGGNKGALSESRPDKEDYEMDDITHKRKPTKEEKRSTQRVRGGLSRFKDRVRDSAGKKLSTAKEKLEGFTYGDAPYKKQQGGGADKKINRVTPHKTSTRGSMSGKKSPAEPEKEFKPSRTSQGTGSERPPDNDPTREWNKEERNREDDVPFKREEGKKPEEKKTERKPKTGETGKKGSTRRGRGKKIKPENHDENLKRLRRSTRARFKNPSKNTSGKTRSTRRGRGRGAGYRRGEDAG